jgi:hypothetical protein
MCWRCWLCPQTVHSSAHPTEERRWDLFLSLDSSVLEAVTSAIGRLRALLQQLCGGVAPFVIHPFCVPSVGWLDVM